MASKSWLSSQENPSSRLSIWALPVARGARSDVSSVVNVRLPCSEKKGNRGRESDLLAARISELTCKNIFVTATQ